MIKINVGGKIFTTKKNTLCISLYFKGLFEFNGELDQDDDGNIHIDRDPHYFKYILSFLRGNEACYLDLTLNQRKELLFEAKFFAIDRLVYLLEPDEIVIDIEIGDKFVSTINNYSGARICYRYNGDDDHLNWDTFYKYITDIVKRNTPYPNHKCYRSSNCNKLTFKKFRQIVNIEFKNGQIRTVKKEE